MNDVQDLPTESLDNDLMKDSMNTMVEWGTSKEAILEELYADCEEWHYDFYIVDHSEWLASRLGM